MELGTRTSARVIVMICPSSARASDGVMASSRIMASVIKARAWPVLGKL